MVEENKLLVEQLVRRIKAGEGNLWDELHRLIGSSIVYIAWKYLHKKEDAEEFVQDFCANIFEIIDRYHFKQSAAAYFCKVAQERAISKYKELYKTEKVTVKYVRFSEIYQNDLCKDRNVELLIMIEQALEKLDEIQRIIIQTLSFEDKTLKALSEELNMPKHKVAALRNAAYKKLAVYLKD